MTQFIATWLALKTNRRAVTALEYGLIAGALVAIVAVAINAFGNDLSNKFNSIGTGL